jgi:hypothetical protein
MIGRRRTDKSFAGSIAARPFDKLRAGACKNARMGHPLIVYR